MPTPNQTPEQAARDRIDEMLSQSGWVVQDKRNIDFGAGLGVAVREYQTDVGPADYVLFVDKRPVGVVEAKPEDWGQKITTVEEQSSAYAAARLKWVNNPGAAAVRLRVHRRVDPFHRRARSQAPIS